MGSTVKDEADIPSWDRLDLAFLHDAVTDSSNSDGNWWMTNTMDLENFQLEKGMEKVGFVGAKDGNNVASLNKIFEFFHIKT